MTRIVALVLLSLAGCSALFTPAPLDPVVRDVYLMGTRARLTSYARTRAQGLARLEDALSVLEATEQELSTWVDESAISRLNHWPVGDPWHAAGSLCGLFSKLYTLRSMTGGAFDPAVGTLVDAWDLHGVGRVPTAAEIDSALGHSSLAQLAFDHASCNLTRTTPVMIDVGAFGKGEGLDRIAAVGIAGPWMIDLGGQLAVSGLPPGATAWRVGLAHPLDRSREVLALALPSGSLSTSAGSERDLTVGSERVGHILDPRTGQPATFRGSVSVWHERGLYADALSTALYVMGPDEGLPWAASLDLAVAYLIPDGDDVRVRATPAFEPLFDGRPGLRTSTR